jgi:hypothetical protein
MELTTTSPTTTTTDDTNPHIQQELLFLQTILELEAELGGQWFVDRAPHVKHWSCRMYYPKWENPDTGGVCVSESFHALFFFRELLDNPEQCFAGMQRELRTAFQSLRTNYRELLAGEAKKLREKAKQAEAAVADMLADNGAN